MVTKEDIKQTLYDELATLIGANTSVTSPYDHVRHDNSNEDEQLPSFVFDETVSPYKLGLDGNIHVHDVTYDTDGFAQSVIYRRDQTISFEIRANTADDAERDADSLYAVLQDYFSEFNAPYSEPSNFHVDAQSVEVFGTSDASRPDEAIRGDSFRVDIRYGRFMEFADFQPMREIHQSFKSGDDTYVTK